MALSFEQVLIEVSRQALMENAKAVELGSERYPVRSTPKRRLRQVDFVLEGNEIRGLEQNPHTKSRWAQLARAGKKVMQFLNEGRYVANVWMGRRRCMAGARRAVNSPQLFKNEQLPLTHAANSGTLDVLVSRWTTSGTACTPKRRTNAS
jgi:hypothetical protein